MALSGGLPRDSLDIVGDERSHLSVPSRGHYLHGRGSDQLRVG
jgi:hypothetical protein